MRLRRHGKYTTLLTALFTIPGVVLAASEKAISPEDASPESMEKSIELEKINGLYQQQVQIYQDQINAQETLFNTYEPAIGEALTGLAAVQFKLGQYQAAIKSYRRAMHIERVNNGIYSLSQEPMIRGLASAYEAMEDLDKANLNYDQLRYIYSRHYQNNSPELVALLKEQSEWHINAYAREPGKNNLYHLGNAYRLMMHALNMASTDTPAGRVAILPLWRNLAIANFLLAEHGRQYSMRDADDLQFKTFGRSEPMVIETLTEDELLVKNSYVSGLVALESIATFHLENPEATIKDRATALAELGDWHLVFGKYQSADQAYRQAWQLTEEKPAIRDDLFSQPHLISVPGENIVFTPHQKEEDNPFVVASLSINSKGKPRDIKITESYPEESDSLQKLAYRTIKKARFRPQLMDGSMVASPEFSYRLELPQ